MFRKKDQPIPRDMYSTTAGDDRSQGEDDSREDVQCYHKYSTAIQVNILTRLQMSI